MIRLLYGTGMRIMECVRLQVKDVDFARGEIMVRQGKGGKDRMAVLPQNDAVPLRDHLGRVKTLPEADLEAGYGGGLSPRCSRPQVSRRATAVGVVRGSMTRCGSDLTGSGEAGG